ncbi:hypothetical protein D3C76_361020 [compost metagenome]
MKMNSESSSKISNKIAQLNAIRKNAKHGEFFFAKYSAIGQSNREAPVFIVGDEDEEDVVICSCTKTPPRNSYDVQVQLKMSTSVRTNKLYTINREQLLFKIPQVPSPEEYKDIMQQLSKFLHM